jgi:ABC-type glycerol-3-phosphate transport system permease component
MATDQLTLPGLNRVRRDRAVTVVLTGVLLAGLAVPLLPLLWTVASSFKPVSDIFIYPPRLLPETATLDNYRRLFSDLPFARWFWNTLWVSLVSTGLALFFSALGGYAFAKYEFRGKTLLFNIVLGSLLVPFAVLLVPLFVFISRIGWADSFLALIVPWVAPAYGIFLMRQYIVQAVPDELIDAGRVDGAGEFRVFWTLVLPLVRPALGALAIWNFLGVYNSFLWPLVVMSSNDKLMLPVGLAQVYGNFNREYGLVMGGAVLAAIPMLVVFVALRRQFIEGLTFGALKG